MIFGMHILTFIVCLIAYIFVMYLWICKITQQELRDLLQRIVNIQSAMSSGEIFLTELILVASDNSIASEIDTPEGLISWIESLQKNFSFSLMYQFNCFKVIIKYIDPRITKWEKELKMQRRKKKYLKSC